MRSMTPEICVPSTSMVNRNSSAAGIRKSFALSRWFAQDLPGMAEVGLLLRRVAVAVGDPFALEHLLELFQRRGDGDGPVVEAVERPVKGVAERQRRRGGGGKAVLVLEPVLRRAQLVGRDRR